MENISEITDQKFKQAAKLYLENNLKEAEKLCLTVRQLNPLNAKNLNLLGLINFNFQKPEESISFLESAVLIEPDNIDYLICLGDVLHEIGRQIESEKCYIKAKELNSDNQEANLKLSKIQGLSLKRMAIVSSHGWSGSNWMASALNLHEKIICTHSARNLLSDGITQNLKATVLERAKARSNGLNISISNILDKIKSYGLAETYACVHTLRARDLPSLLNHAPQNLSITVANLIRNPVSVVSSGTSQLTELVEFDISTLNEVTTTARSFATPYYKICDEYRLDPCRLKYLCAFDACSHLRYLQEDIPTAKSMKNMQMELLVSDPEYFAECFYFITNGEVADTHYLKKVYGLGKINQHNKKETPSSAEEEWNSWPDWKQEMFSFFLNQTDVLSFYRSQGYDLGYI